MSFVSPILARGRGAPANWPFPPAPGRPERFFYSRRRRPSAQWRRCGSRGGRRGPPAIYGAWSPGGAKRTRTGPGPGGAGVVKGNGRQEGQREGQCVARAGAITCILPPGRGLQASPKCAGMHYDPFSRNLKLKKKPAAHRAGVFLLKPRAAFFAESKIQVNSRDLDMSHRTATYMGI